MLKVGSERVEAVVAVGDGGHVVCEGGGLLETGSGKWGLSVIGAVEGVEGVEGHDNPATRARSESIIV